MSHKYDLSPCLAKKNIAMDSGSLGTSHLSRLYCVLDLRVRSMCLSVDLCDYFHVCMGNGIHTNVFANLNVNQLC